MLLDLDSLVEGRRGVVCMHWHSRLTEDGPGVYALIHEVNGAAAFTGSIGDCLLPSGHSGVCGKKRGMDVKNALRKGLEERFFDQPHEACQADQVHLSVPEAASCFFLRGLGESRLIISAVDQLGFDLMLAGSLEDKSLGIIREHERNAGIETSFADRIQDGLHIRAGAGAENSQGEHEAFCNGEKGSSKFEERVFINFS